jgi:cobalt-zinc-cadmium efflux system outer membrane protein
MSACKKSRLVLQLLLVLGGLALLAGCLPMRAPEPGEPVLARARVAVAEQPAPAWTASLVEQITTAASSPEPTGATGDLDTLVNDTIAHNPGLRASWSDFESALQRIPQVSSLTEPMVTATIPIEKVQTRTGPQDFILGIQQRFPWFGVLDLRGQAAYEMAQERLQRYLTDLLTTVRRAQGLWWEIAYQESARSIALEEMDLLKDFAEIAASRYATGVGPQQAVLKADVEISRVQEQLITIDERVATLTTELNALRDRAPRTPVEIPALSDQSLPAYDLDVSALIASAESMRPELGELRHRMERFERERRLARDKFFPEFMIGANWIAVGSRPDHPAAPPSDEGQDAYNVVVGATVPLWWRAYRGAVGEAERNIESTQERLADTRNRVGSEVTTADIAMTEARDLMELYATALIPQAEQTLEATQAGYSTGQLSFLDLLDAERVLLRLRLAHEKARRDYLLAVADLERAVGAAMIPTARDAGGSRNGVAGRLGREGDSGP